MTAISPTTDLHLPIHTAACLKIRQYSGGPTDVNVIYRHEEDDVQVEVHLSLSIQATADFIKRFFPNPNLRFSILGPNQLSYAPVVKRKPKAIWFQFNSVRSPACFFFQSAIAPLFFSGQDWLISPVQQKKLFSAFSVQRVAKESTKVRRTKTTEALQSMMDRFDSMAIEKINGFKLQIHPYIQPLENRAIFCIGSDLSIRERFLCADGTHILDQPSIFQGMDIAIQGFLNKKLIEVRFFCAVKDRLQTLQARKEAKAFCELLFKLNKPPCLIPIFDLITSNQPLVQQKVNVSRSLQILDCFKAFLQGTGWLNSKWLEKEDLDTVLYCAKESLNSLELKKWPTLFLKLLSRLADLRSIRSSFFQLVTSEERDPD
jgi:hypothetical protein